MTVRSETIRPALVSALAACCLALTAAPVLAAEPTAAPEPTDVAEPAAKPAQSGADEYGEEGVPLGTGEDEDPAPVEEEPESTPAPTPAPAPTGSGDAAAETTTTAPTGTELPRTGADAWLIALIAIALIAAGILVRRTRIAAPHG